MRFGTRARLTILLAVVAAVPGLGAGLALAHGTNPDIHYIGHNACNYKGQATFFGSGPTRSSGLTQYQYGTCGEFIAEQWAWNGSDYIQYTDPNGWVPYTQTAIALQDDFYTTQVYGYHQHRLNGVYASTSETYASN